MTIVVAFNPVNYDNVRRKEAQRVAIKVLSLAPKFVFPIAFGFRDEKPIEFVKDFNIITLNTLKKDSSKILSNDRKLPYIKEILDICSRIECKVFGYINSDILLDNNVYRLLQSDKDAFIFSRSDTAEVTVEDFMAGKVKVIYGGDKHIGADGFFFNKKWWIKNRQYFPEGLLTASTEWDTCYRHIIKKLTNNYIEKRALYHVYHNQTWTKTSSEAVNNIKIWEEIKDEVLWTI